MSDEIPSLPEGHPRFRMFNGKAQFKSNRIVSNWHDISNICNDLLEDCCCVAAIAWKEAINKMPDEWMKTCKEYGPRFFPWAAYCHKYEKAWLAYKNELLCGEKKGRMG